METFPMSITELVELRYLSLSITEIEEVPEELGKLVKLNFLYLSNIWRLKKIPSGVIGSLVELRVFTLFGSYQVDWDLDEVYNLKHLNDLGISINTEHNSSSSSLTKLLSSSNKKLQKCTRHLWLNSYRFGSLEKLQLLFNLETLRLLELPEADQLMMNMVGIEQQQHLGSSCFQNLRDICIWNCNGLKDLTWVGYVPNLKILNVRECKELEEIYEIVVIVVVDDLGGGDEIIFKSLKTLILYALPKLKSICRNALAFPSLMSMDIDRCPRLKKLPFDSGSNVNNTLQKIYGKPQWWNELGWEGEDHNNNELLKSKFLPYFHPYLQL